MPWVRISELMVRFSGGWEFEEADAKSRLPGEVGYRKGVPMGGDLRKAPAVGNTVDVATASWTNTIGDPELIDVWTDPDFDPDQRAYTSPIWYAP
jgi:hypothetical protein